MELEWQSVSKSEQLGGNYFGLEIRMKGKTLPDLESDLIRRAVWDAERAIKNAVIIESNLTDPLAIDANKKNRQLIDEVFGDNKIFVEEIPNGYCGDGCCSHLPWFIVTTEIGRIKIGWRKRVINIDWSECLCEATSDILFREENVTKGDHSIHAHSIDLAREYVDVILDNVV